MRQIRLDSPFWKLHNYLFWAVMVFSLCPRASFADSEAPPKSYKIVTANGKYVFIMHPHPGRSVFRDKSLLEEYPATGLYTNDQRKTLLWPVDWYASQVYVSSDGEHLIRVGPWPLGSPLLPEKKFDAAEILIKVHNKEPVGPAVDQEALNQLALSFYDRGTLIKEYSIGDLIRKPAELPTSVSHFRWDDGISYSDENGQINLATCDGQNYIFDLNGNALRSKLT